MEPTTLLLELKRRISTQGKITFAEFMELALYWPRGGYYAQSRAAGADFFTAPAAHPAFGALLSLQLEELWHTLGSPAPFVVVEPGAGWGHLAGDSIAYAQHLEPAFAASLHYIAIDRAARPPEGILPLVHWVQSQGLSLRGITGCIVSNELFDAMPVHRVVIRDGRLREVYVTFKDGKLAEEEDNPTTPALEHRLIDEGITLAEGQKAEVCLALNPWVQEASQTLERGYLLTVDYGHPASALYAPARTGGTLRCYYQHTVSASPYDYPGGQDITAHVDFTALAALGKRYGLESYPLITQGEFLRNLGLLDFQRRLANAGLPQPERDANRMAMLELARPGGMGDFKVLVQRKGAPEARLAGMVGPSPAWKDRLARLPLPLLTARHLAILAARYPQTTQNFDALWR